MSQNLEDCLYQLLLVAKIRDPKLRKSVLKDFSINECYYKALKEISVNIVSRNVPLNTEQKKKLRKYKKDIKALACPKAGIMKKRKLVQQSGGYLPILLPIIASFLGSVLFK